ncbi:nucleotidyltransferase domain-containing protein [Candidatus Woesearchaeota archaeon]|nr:nucleotidyltransferase domain-containing protein [Candidatus Woesearchaeota archaeon]
MKNEELIRILNAIGDLLDIQDVKYKPESYRKVARAIEGMVEEVFDEYKAGRLYEIPGVGEHIGKKIEEILETGRSSYYEQLKKEVNVDVEALRQIPFLGPKKIKVLYKQLNVRSVKDLEKAIKQRKVRELPGFGLKTEETFLDGIAVLKFKPKRYPIANIVPIANQILRSLKRFKSVDKVEIAGSFRRKKATVKDLDVLIVSKNPDAVVKAFTSMKGISKVLARGITKSVIRLENGMHVDLRVVKANQWGAALMYFTGTKDFNIYVRKLALRKGWTLNEYALSEVATKKVIASKTEKAIFSKLGLKYVEPENREERKNWKT